MSIPLALAALAAVIAIPLVGDADVEPTTIAAPVVDSQDLAAGQSALRAYRNSETGGIEVGPAGVAGLPLDPDTREALRRDSEGLVEVHHPDGSVSVNLQGRFQNVAVVHIGEDGKAMICTEHAHGVERALDGRTNQTLEVE
jgi:hypothetical protein